MWRLLSVLLRSDKLLEELFVCGVRGTKRVFRSDERSLAGYRDRHAINLDMLLILSGVVVNHIASLREEIDG